MSISCPSPGGISAAAPSLCSLPSPSTCAPPGSHMFIAVFHGRHSWLPYSVFLSSQSSAVRRYVFGSSTRASLEVHTSMPRARCPSASSSTRLKYTQGTASVIHSLSHRQRHLSHSLAARVLFALTAWSWYVISRRHSSLSHVRVRRTLPASPSAKTSFLFDGVASRLMPSSSEVIVAVLSESWY